MKTEVKNAIPAPALVKMKPLFEKAAGVIANAIGSKTIKIRYDGDADGILSALILKKCVEKLAKGGISLRTQESRGAVYSEKDHEEDKATLPQGSLLVLLDHGANEESKENLCNSAKLFEIMVVDHHPPAESHCIKHFVSPFQAKNCKEPSSYNTGLLCFEIGRRMAPELEKELLPLCLYSMQADTSSFRKKEFFPEAVVVDYLAVKASEPYQLEFYEKILVDKHLVKELHREEEAAMQSALQSALRKAKIKKGRFAVITCNVSGVARKRGYPSIGKLHNAVQFHFAEKGPTASLLYTKERLSFRSTHSAADLGFSANKVINSLKEEYGKHGFTGGGHIVAASSKFPKEYGKEIISKAINMTMQDAGIC